MRRLPGKFDGGLFSGLSVSAERGRIVSRPDANGVSKRRERGGGGSLAGDRSPSVLAHILNWVAIFSKGDKP